MRFLVRLPAVRAKEIVDEWALPFWGCERREIARRRA